MNIKEALRSLTKFEWVLWLGSMMLILLSYCVGRELDSLVLLASLVGATMLIFVSKGEPFGQVMAILFALLYGYISWRQRYYGEMITYLGMSAPMAALALFSWMRNPFQQGKSQVRVEKLNAAKLVLLVVATVAVTWLFYFILKWLDTPNLMLSTLSITTSFLAVGLTYLRSPHYALAYAGNDLVLIGLWVLAGERDASCWPMVTCFVVFLINDLYGFVNWCRMRMRQQGMENI